MKDEKQRILAVEGLILEDRLRESAIRAVNTIESAFEMLSIIDPMLALDVVQEIGMQINQESVDKLLEDTEKYKATLLAKINLEDTDEQ